MTTGIIDTHILFWYLQGGKKLSAAELLFLDGDSNHLVLPAIVLCEAKHLIAKKRVSLDYDRLFAEVANDPRIEIAALDSEVLEFVPTSLDIHDAIIVGTYLHYERQAPKDTVLLTQDHAIRRSKLARVLV